MSRKSQCLWLTDWLFMTLKHHTRKIGLTIHMKIYTIEGIDNGPWDPTLFRFLPFNTCTLGLGFRFILLGHTSKGSYPTSYSRRVRIRGPPPCNFWRVRLKQSLAVLCISKPDISIKEWHVHILCFGCFSSKKLSWMCAPLSDIVRIMLP